MSCTQCGSGSISELGSETPPHKFYHQCHGHEYRGLVVTRRDWDRYVNSECDELVGTPQSDAGDKL